MDLSGTRCEQHPSVPATFVCERCGSFGCAECEGSSITPQLCGRCRARQPAQMPWEVSARPTLSAYWVTVWSCFRHPWKTFAETRMDRTDRALSFAVITGLAGSLVIALTQERRPILQQTATGWLSKPAPSVIETLEKISLFFGGEATIQILVWTGAMSLLARRRDAVAPAFRLACYGLAPFPLLTPMFKWPASIPFLGLLFAFYMATYGAAAARPRFAASPIAGAIISCIAALSALPLVIYALRTVGLLLHGMFAAN
jgi:hypothetical protein